MIFTHNTFDDPNFKGFACPSHQVSDSLRHLSIQHLVAILRYPDKVLLNLKHRMTAVSVFHTTPPFVRHIAAAKADRLKPMV